MLLRFLFEVHAFENVNVIFSTGVIMT